MNDYETNSNEQKAVARFSDEKEIVVANFTQNQIISRNNETEHHLDTLTRTKQESLSNEALLQDSIAIALSSRALQLGDVLVRKALREVSRHQQIQLFRQPFTRGRKMGVREGQINGLRNLGNSCYFNATIQSLSSSQVFIEYLRNINKKEFLLETDDTGTERDGHKEVIALLLDLIDGVNGHVAECYEPKDLLMQVARKHEQFRPRFGPETITIGREQHDAQELLQALISSCVDDSNFETMFPSCIDPVDWIRSGPNSFIHDTERDTEHSLSEVIDRSTLMRSTRVIHGTTSVTPSPLCGWTGSILQCRLCKSVRPIRNTPFFDLPIVPTSLSGRGNSFVNAQTPAKGASRNAQAPCTLEECLEEFITIERVTDVECWTCTLKEELAALSEDVLILRNAIDSLSERVSEDESGQLEALRDEYNTKERRLNRLIRLPMDDNDAIESALKEYEEEEISPIQVLRSDAFKCLSITRLPSILCLHVQRKYYDPYKNQLVKTDQFVQFPEILDLAPYSGHMASNAFEPKIPDGIDSSPFPGSIHYELIAVVEHIGNAFAGHYICYRRNFRKPGEWLLISDDSIRPCSWEYVRRCRAYMLFYEAL